MIIFESEEIFSIVPGTPVGDTKGSSLNQVQSGF